MARYKLLAGLHTESNDAKGRPIMYRKGDVFDSDCDLESLNAKGMPPKFEKLSEDYQQEDPRDLHSMTKQQLRAYAADIGVEMDDATIRKDEMISLIQQALDVA